MVKALKITINSSGARLTGYRLNALGSYIQNNLNTSEIKNLFTDC